MRLLRSPEERFMADRKVLFHFHPPEERSLEGYVVRETRNSYFIARTKLLAGKAEFDLEGIILVPKRDVFFPQVLGPEQAL